MELTDDLRDEYSRLWGECVPNPDHLSTVKWVADRVIAGRGAYLLVHEDTGVPWVVVGVIHGMEASFDFTRHLHNGDPLTDRTVRVPAGRPLGGDPPFQWTYSATDALRLMKMDQWTDWSVPGTLFKLEAYNGWGYRSRGINTPYLWSMSNLYSKGKFVADHKYDPEAVSKQTGAGVVLRILADAGKWTPAG